MSLIWIAAIVPVFSTLAGGWTVFRLSHRIHPIMAFAAGVLVATALLDLAPEGIDIVGASVALPLMLVGFLLYTATEAVAEANAHEHVHHEIGSHDHPSQDVAQEPAKTSLRTTVTAMLAPVGLIFHSGMDGVAIGLGFQASASIGLLVTLAVVGHDFADGLNVVTMALSNGIGRRRARILLVLDAVIVPIGVLAGTVFGVNRHWLGVMLSLFAGGFIAIGAGHLLPEARHQESDAGLRLTIAAIVGAGCAALIRSVAAV